MKKEIKITLTLKEADYIMTALETSAKLSNEHEKNLRAILVKISGEISKEFNCKNYEDFKKVMGL